MTGLGQPARWNRMKITRLRLLGFKSFVEPVDIPVEPGLTGVVGPNGCGKSNLLEAIRWVMGETSFKSMRASAMEDVIFGGTQTRPARNLAEVTIFIDNSDRTAPAELNDADMLEVSRRIEREAGSAYKVNGRECRARDVRLLFEDAATGAHSPALVRQGRIGEIVNAKPQDRRRLLEDAAGIAGLHSRRHEAELRLKAAETNLDRLQDLSGQMASQLQSLKRQARQAQKYRELSTRMREAEALLAHVNWQGVCAAVDQDERALSDALSRLARATQAESESLRTQAGIADRIPGLRTEENVRAAVLQRLNVERERLEREAERAAERRRELETRLAQARRDLDREEAAIEEAATFIARLTEDRTALDAQTDETDDTALRGRVEAAHDALTEAEAAFSIATSDAAEHRAQTQTLDTARHQTARRVETLQADVARARAALEALETELAADGERDRLAAELTDLQARYAEGETALEAAERERETTAQEEAEARDAANRTRLRARQLETEIQTLTKLLTPVSTGDWTPVSELVKVAPGYEAALAAGLGDSLDAPDDANAPAHWRVLVDYGAAHALPSGAAMLSAYVQGPAALTRRLSQIGVVDAGEGAALQAQLAPGQRLVSRAGDLWRWDGYAAAAKAPTPAAIRFAERNRLQVLQGEVETARDAAAASDAAFDNAAIRARSADEAAKDLRQAVRDTSNAVSRLRDAAMQAERKAQAASARLGGLKEAFDHNTSALDDACEAAAAAQQAFVAHPPGERFAQELDAARSRVDEARSAYTEARSVLDGVERERRLKRERLQAIADDLTRWAKRKTDAEAQGAALTERETGTRAELVALDALPGEIEKRRQTLMNELSKAESERRTAADALAAGEAAQRQADQAGRVAQMALAAAGEERGRAETRLEAARERRGAQARAIRDLLDCAPDDCLRLAGGSPGAEIPPLHEVEQKLARYRADRERLGGVNLRADEEATALQTQLDEMERERDDVVSAIAKLRGGIAALNRDGRARLLEAFDIVNGHFKRLFETLFGGGQAELQLIESDDPLESGLEILAQPPGKKAQVLTLLSGGEKALTALALMFAVFLTNPSPICVLDEVDAPLDDANVERFCNLMEEMTKLTDTRFFVITHHPMTMARMHRLFGVTMAERGVSQLVSVDLEEAERYLEAG